MSHQEHFYDDRESLLAGLQTHLLTSLQHALAQRSRASVALSGGSTPAPLYAALSQQILDWNQVDLCLTDERYVPVEHPDSNQAMLQRTLMQGPAAAANLVPLMHTSDDAAQAAQLASEAMATLDWPLDIVLLGMGADMHTASLFPDAAEISAALAPDQSQLCMAVQPASSPYPRLSLTLTALLRSREIILLITGEDKRQALQQALSTEDVKQAPIAAVLRQAAAPVSVFWSP